MWTNVKHKLLTDNNTICWNAIFIPFLCNKTFKVVTHFIYTLDVLSRVRSYLWSIEPDSSRYTTHWCITSRSTQITKNKVVTEFLSTSSGLHPCISICYLQSLRSISQCCWIHLLLLSFSLQRDTQPHMTKPGVDFFRWKINVPVQNCTCMPGFSIGYFVVSVQSYWGKSCCQLVTHPPPSSHSISSCNMLRTSAYAEELQTDRTQLSGPQAQTCPCSTNIYKATATGNKSAQSNLARGPRRGAVAHVRPIGLCGQWCTPNSPPKSTPFRGPIAKPHHLPHHWTRPTYDAKRHPDLIRHFSTMH